MSTVTSSLAKVFAAAFLALAATAASHAEKSPPYLSGGIGKGGVQAMKVAAIDYTTMLTFANKAGEYLADVDVTIKNRDGDALVSTVTNGPILLVDLPAGRYQVEASFEGKHVTRNIFVPAKRRENELIHL